MEHLLLIRKLIPENEIRSEESQRELPFHTRCTIKGKVATVIIDGGSCANLISTEVVEKLGLATEPHPQPYLIHGLNQEQGISVTSRCLISLSIGKNYRDELWCDLAHMDACHIIFGRPWIFDRRVNYNGFNNFYSFEKDGKRIKLIPMSPCELISKPEVKKKNGGENPTLINEPVKGMIESSYTLGPQTELWEHFSKPDLTKVQLPNRHDKPYAQLIDHVTILGDSSTLGSEIKFSSEGLLPKRTRGPMARHRQQLPSHDPVRQARAKICGAPTLQPIINFGPTVQSQSISKAYYDPYFQVANKNFLNIRGTTISFFSNNFIISEIKDIIFMVVCVKNKIESINVLIKRKDEVEFTFALFDIQKHVILQWPKKPPKEFYNPCYYFGKRGEPYLKTVRSTPIKITPREFENFRECDLMIKPSTNNVHPYTLTTASNFFDGFVFPVAKPDGQSSCFFLNHPQKNILPYIFWPKPAFSPKPNLKELVRMTYIKEEEESQRLKPPSSPLGCEYSSTINHVFKGHSSSEYQNFDLQVKEELTSNIVHGGQDHSLSYVAKAIKRGIKFVQNLWTNFFQEGEDDAHGLSASDYSGSSPTPFKLPSSIIINRALISFSSLLLLSLLLLFKILFEEGEDHNFYSQATSSFSRNSTGRKFMIIINLRLFKLINVHSCGIINSNSDDSSKGRSMLQFTSPYVRKKPRPILMPGGPHTNPQLRAHFPSILISTYLAENVH